MADSMDLVQQRVEEERQRHIHIARCTVISPATASRQSGALALRQVRKNRQKKSSLFASHGRGFLILTRQADPIPALYVRFAREPSRR